MTYGSAAFYYPGSKSQLADWIINHLPPHDCYVEPFAGSLAVLFSKPSSPVEVVNDVNDDIVHFFETVRDEGDALAEWVRGTPYSRARYEEWVTQFYRRNKRPADDIERAGRFLYTLQAGVSGGFDTGFSIETGGSPGGKDPTRSWRYKSGDILEMRDRLCEVVIEHLNYAAVVEKYDRPHTVFYFDPPYVDAEADLYGVGEFNHTAFCETLRGLDGRFVCSYSELPDSVASGVDEGVFHTTARTVRNRLASNSNPKNIEDVEIEEVLVMNFNPTTTERMRSIGQATVEDYT